MVNLFLDVAVPQSALIWVHGRTNRTGIGSNQ